MSNEADTCRKFVLPKLMAAGWDGDPHSFTEQKTFTDGRIVVSGDRILRRPPKVGRAAVIVPNGTLFGDGVCAWIKEDVTHLPPEQLVESILQKEQRIMEIMGRIKALLEMSS